MADFGAYRFPDADWPEGCSPVNTQDFHGFPAGTVRLVPFDEEHPAEVRLDTVVDEIDGIRVPRVIAEFTYRFEYRAGGWGQGDGETESTDEETR